MWPKLIAQLFDLMPHINRLVPMAEKYFSSKSTSEKAVETALAQMGTGIRSDLGQLQAHSAQLAAIQEQVRLTQLAMEQREHRVELLSRQVTTLTTWVRASAALTLLLLLALLAISLRAHR